MLMHISVTGLVFV